MLIAALVGLAVLNPVHVPCYAQTSPKEPDASPQQDAKPIDLSPIRDEIQRLTRAVESIKPEGKPADEIQREQDDLKAQEDMAKWARLMYLATAWMTALTAFGVLLLGATLYFTKQAAISADKMVEEAKLATKAAEASVAETQRIGEAQVRAYVTVSEVAVFLENTCPVVNFRVFNGGNSPALSLQVTASIAIGVEKDAVLSDGINAPSVSVLIGTVRQGQERPVSLHVGTVWLTKEQIANLPNTKYIKFVARVSVTYLDVFSARRTDTWEFMAVTSQPQPGFTLGMAPMFDFHHDELERLKRIMKNNREGEDAA